MAMSELQIALIGAGAAAVAAVWGYNAWQERKHRKAAESIFKAGQGDALLNDVPPSGELHRSAEPAERLEPTFAPEPSDPVEAITPVVLPVDSLPELEATSVSQADSVAAAPLPVLPAVEPAPVAPPPKPEFPIEWVDAFSDCILRFSLADPAPAPAIWSLQTGWSAELTKPLTWLAREDADTPWQRIDADQTGRFREWVAALQLVDRRGAASDGELGRFIDGVGQVVAPLGVSLAPTSRGDAVLRANRLDQLCAAVDIQFVIHIVEASGGVFAGTKLRGVAEACGLSLGNDGCFHARDAGGAELFTLGNMGTEKLSADTIKSLATHGLTLTLDVPRVSDGAMTFDQMLNSAGQLSKALGGVLVDAQRAPLAQAMITGIRAKIIELQQRMRDGGIEPGSTRALRLFS